ncbi:MAG: hypothetical protein EAX96_04830 [Candidatus Lokiarchaeota archaeon]|nr:hypothetical protein [Candidatus Lokiarchaeota archaeon]
MNSISGVQRRTTAAEGARRFITTELLTSRLKRESDREKIKELLNNRGKIQDYLIAAGVIHLYHYVGLKTQDLAKISESMLTLDAEKLYEKTQKDHLLTELTDIVQNFIFNELEIYEKQLNLDLEILNNTIERNESKDPLKDQIYEDNNKKLIHKTLISLFRKYSEQFFYDFIGRIYDLADTKRNDILVKASDLKATSLEIEQELKKEYEDDEKFIELITFNYLKEQINKMWELKGHIRQLETQKVTLNRIESDILKKLIENLPFSKMGLQAKKAAIELKLDIVNYVKDVYNEQKTIDEIENEINEKIKASLIKQALEGPQLFLNFLSEYLSMTFDEVVDFLKNFQVNSVPAFCQALSVPVEPIKNKLFELHIGDRELSQLSETGALMKVKTYFQNYKARGESEFITGLTIYQLYENQSVNIDYIKGKIEEEIKVSSARIKELLEIEKQLNSEILIPYELEGVNQLRLILNLQSILTEIEKELFYSNFKNFLLFYSRIVELYQKIKKDKEIFLMAFKRISDLKSTEKWIEVKLEDLIIEKIMKRQSEIQELSLKYDPLYINCLIYARLANESFDKSKKDLTTTKSPIYTGILPIPIKYENLPPISYATAYDILKRMERDYFERKKIKEVKIKERKKEEEKEKKEIIQDVDTYSWIEKRINMSLMRMGGGIDPTSLYWNEKDSEKLSKFILLHTQVKKDKKICSIDGNYVLDTCKEHPNAIILTAGVIENVASFYKFSTQKLKDIEYSRLLEITEEIALEILKVRGKSDVSALVEGEIQELGRRIGEKIGKLLNNSLYKTWKKKKLGR